MCKIFHTGGDMEIHAVNLWGEDNSKMLATLALLIVGLGKN